VREVEASKSHKLKKVEDVPGAKSGTISNQSKVGGRVPRSPIIQPVETGRTGEKQPGRNQRQKPGQKPETKAETKAETNGQKPEVSTR
jgi:hypothetical protein